MGRRIAMLLAGLLALLSSTAALAASPSPGASPVTDGVPFVSPVYGYTIVVPAGWSARPASAAWDGSSRVDSSAPITDQLQGPLGLFLFVYGGPTGLALGDFAAEQQRNTAAWHGCPDVPDSIVETTLSGVPARLHTFLCQGNLVHKLFAVRDGMALVVNQIGLPQDPQATADRFLETVASLAWPVATPSPAAPSPSPSGIP